MNVYLYSIKSYDYISCKLVLMVAWTYVCVSVCVCVCLCVLVWLRMCVSVYVCECLDTVWKSIRFESELPCFCSICRFCINMRASQHWRCWTKVRHQSSYRCPKTMAMLSWRCGHGGTAGTALPMRRLCPGTQVSSLLGDIACLQLICAKGKLPVRSEIRWLLSWIVIWESWSWHLSQTWHIHTRLGPADNLYYIWEDSMRTQLI